MVAAGETPLAPAVMHRLITRFLEQPAPATPPTHDPRIRRLSERERQVLCLVARGLSNAEIAEELVVSPATVKTHVASLLNKLGVHARIQATVIAYESGLVGR
jgi:DNA-binding NarL/FixJ family response regulator